MKILDEYIIRKNLMIASLFLSGYELLKNCIIDDLKSFFITGFNEKEYKYDEKYLKICPNKKTLYQDSCNYLLVMQAITNEELIALENIRIYRNKVAHNLNSILVDEQQNIDIELLRKLSHLLTKIDNHWCQIDFEIMNDGENENVDYENIQSGRKLLFDHFVKIVDEYTRN